MSGFTIEIERRPEYGPQMPTVHPSDLGRFTQKRCRNAWWCRHPPSRAPPKCCVAAAHHAAMRRGEGIWCCTSCCICPGRWAPDRPLGADVETLKLKAEKQMVQLRLHVPPKGFNVLAALVNSCQQCHRTYRFCLETSLMEVFTPLASPADLLFLVIRWSWLKSLMDCRWPKREKGAALPGRGFQQASPWLTGPQSRHGRLIPYQAAAFGWFYDGMHMYGQLEDWWFQHVPTIYIYLFI